MSSRGVLSQGARVLKRAVSSNIQYRRKTRKVLRRAKSLREVLETLHKHRTTLPVPHKAVVQDLLRAVDKLTAWEAARAKQHSQLIVSVQRSVINLEDATTLIRCDQLACKNEAGKLVSRNPPSEQPKSSGVRWLTEKELSLPLLCTPLMVQKQTKT